MILKISWRNIWRNRTRSLVVISAVAIGVWSVIFLSSFSIGMGKSYIDSAIEKQISHIQIHHKKFIEEKSVRYNYDPETDLKLSPIRDQIKAYTHRSVAMGMISSSRGIRGIEIRGIDPENEQLVTKLEEKIVEGDYLSPDVQRGILVSTELAEKLKLKLRKKVALRFQDSNNNLVDGGFRIVGLFQTDNSMYDESVVFINRSQFNSLIEKEGIAHETAILVNNFDQLEDVYSQIKASNGNLLVRDYQEIAPDIALFNSQIKLTTLIFTIIVMLGLIFGIINTMLMAVLERIRELGMLMSIGMGKFRVFGMIVLETLLLGLVGLPFGLALSYLTVNWLSKIGLDLSSWSEGMREFGMAQIVYPVIDNSAFIQLSFAVVITSLLASLYPAYKAIKLKPVEAIRTL